MEHDVRDLNRLITSSKAIEYTAGKYFYQSFYTWIISCSESCYNKPIFPPLLISLTLSLKSQSHLIVLGKGRCLVVSSEASIFFPFFTSSLEVYRCFKECFVDPGTEM